MMHGLQETVYQKLETGSGFHGKKLFPLKWSQKLTCCFSKEKHGI
jgi:hypothetical protein